MAVHAQVDHNHHQETEEVATDTTKSTMARVAGLSATTMVFRWINFSILTHPSIGDAEVFSQVRMSALVEMHLQKACYEAFHGVFCFIYMVSLGAGVSRP